MKDDDITFVQFLLESLSKTFFPISCWENTSMLAKGPHSAWGGMRLTRTEAESNEKERWVLTNKRGVISMGYISVHGRYHHGKIELLEDLVPDEGSELIITVLSKESKSKDPELEQDPWRILKGQIVARYPELKRESKQKAVTEFERLSEKIASNMRFKTLEELEKFMRREDYDLS